MKVKGKHVVLSLVFLVIGFLLAFSYEHTKKESKVVQLSDKEWETDYYYRQQLISLEEKNIELRQEINKNRQEVQQLEQELGQQESNIGDYVESKKELQMLVGELPVSGEGVEITLKDAEYVPSDENVNQYLVHDRHIHLVINELYSSGAKAISVNGQRIYRDSYIDCVGPVISIDGVSHPAPFKIAAIGDPEVLSVSMNLTNGVIDTLVSENVEVTLERKDKIEMKARIS